LSKWEEAFRKDGTASKTRGSHLSIALHPNYG